MKGSLLTDARNRSRMRNVGKVRALRALEPKKASSTLVKLPDDPHRVERR